MNEFYVADTHKTTAILAECQKSGPAMMEQRIPGNMQNCVMNDYEQRPKGIGNFPQSSFSVWKKVLPGAGWQLCSVHGGSEIFTTTPAFHSVRFPHWMVPEFCENTA